MLTSLPISMLYLSLLSAVAMVLTIRIVKFRIKMSISLGDGKDEFMNRQIRVQANFLENLLPFSLMFILAELNSTSIIILHLTGTAFLLSRLLHAFGLTNKAGRSTGRYYGTLVTWMSVIVLIAVNLYNAILTLL